jgi:hypothetical protein
MSAGDIENLAHSFPDVKGRSRFQPGTPFISPIRGRPCPGRLFFCAQRDR